MFSASASASAAAATAAVFIVVVHRLLIGIYNDRILAVVAPDNQI